MNVLVYFILTAEGPVYLANSDIFYRMVRELDGQYGFKRYLGDGFGSEFEDAAKR